MHSFLATQEKKKVLKHEFLRFLVRHLISSQLLLCVHHFIISCEGRKISSPANCFLWLWGLFYFVTWRVCLFQEGLHRRQSLKKRFEWLFFFPNLSWMLQQYHLSWCRGEKLMIRSQEFFRVWRLWRHSPVEHWLGRTLRAVFPRAEVTSFTHFRLRGH